MIPTFKSFRKITRASAVQQVTREHYLRDDIPCGIIACTLCSASINNKAVIQGPEVLVPDTNILLHHLETLTHFQDVILMQTVLDEVRARNSAIYNRTRALLAESSCRWFVFPMSTTRIHMFRQRQAKKANRQMTGTTELSGQLPIGTPSMLPECKSCC